jgi:3-oxoacyl-[acyl-carrier-protein] synthase II
MIVVTGLGAITALGATVDETWARLLRGERAFSEVTLFPADGYRVRLVAEVPGLRGGGADDDSRTSELALAAAKEALGSAGLACPSARPTRLGLVVGGSTAGMLETEMLLSLGLSPAGGVDPGVRDEELRRMLSHPLSAPTARLARELGPFARVRSLSSACSSGASAILVGATWLELGLVDAVLCGAADALCRITLSGFNALASLDPEGARPFDRRRRGLTLGEGAGFVVLERREAARARGQAALCALLGWSAAAEAHHITNPEPEGRVASGTMEAALRRAGRTPADVDYVSAHGTGTPLNDAMESRALLRVLGDAGARVPVSSPKGQLGHTLAACGAIEAVLTAMAVIQGVVPPTGGLEEPDPACPLRHVLAAEALSVDVALSSSFGFGGMDTALVLGRVGEVARGRAPARRAVVVTGASVITPAGLFSGPAAAEVATLPCTEDTIGLDLDGELDAVRARRLDRVSRLGVIAAAAALGDDACDAGIVFGNAFGAVDATSVYMRRVREKGARLASPADFPGLVPSSPAGQVSIYLGLSGPTLAVADLATSGECAVTQGWELVASGEADRVVAVGVEERSTIVDQVFRVFFGPGRGDPLAVGDRAVRREGAGAVALAAAEVARARGLPVLAHVLGVLAWWDADGTLQAVLAPPPRGEATGAVVLVAPAGAAVEALLRGAGWAGCRRIVCGERTGSHEAAGGIGVAVGAALLASDVGLDAVLCVGMGRGPGYAITLGRAAPAPEVAP